MNENVMSVQDEHRAFRPYLEEMDVIAGSIDTIPVKELSQRLARLHEFLAHELMPHAVAEGRVLVPYRVRRTGRSVSHTTDDPLPCTDGDLSRRRVGRPPP